MTALLDLRGVLRVALLLEGVVGLVLPLFGGATLAVFVGGLLGAVEPPVGLLGGLFGLLVGVVVSVGVVGVVLVSTMPNV